MLTAEHMQIVQNSLRKKLKIEKDYIWRKKIALHDIDSLCQLAL